MESGLTSKLAIPQLSQQLVILAYVLVGSGLLVLLAGNKLIAEFAKQIAAKPLVVGANTGNVHSEKGALPWWRWASSSSSPSS